MSVEEVEGFINHKDGELFNSSYPLNMGDESSFDFIYESYFAPLCVFANRFVGNEALDIVNNLFAKLWSSQTSFTNEKHTQSFLYLAIKNACLDLLKTTGRSKKREEEYSLLLTMTESDLEVQTIHNEYYAEIFRELKNLPPQCSKILQMSYLDGMSNEEVANELNLSIQTVKNQKYKGLKMLRKRLSISPETLKLLLFMLNI